jgi:hypothetical protein
MISEQDETDFLADLEEQIGEKTLWMSLGENLTTFGGAEKNTVGLFFLTSSSFGFQTNPKKDFFSALLTSFRRKRKKEEPVGYLLPREFILTFRREKPKGLSKFFAGSSMPLFTLAFDETAGRKSAAVAFRKEGPEKRSGGQSRAEAHVQELKITVVSEERARELESLFGIQADVPPGGPEAETRRRDRAGKGRTGSRKNKET